MKVNSQTHTDNRLIHASGAYLGGGD